MAKRTNVSLQEALKEYAGYSDEDFHSLTVTELRRILSSELGVSYIEREDEPEVQTNRARKSEIIKAIKEAVHPVKVVEAVAPNLTTSQINELIAKVRLEKFDNILQYADKVYSRLLTYVDSLWNAETQTWRDETQEPHSIAHEVVAYLNFSIDGEGKTYADATKTSHATKMYKYIRTRAEKQPDISEGMRAKLFRAIEQFENTKRVNMADVYKRVKEDADKRNLERDKHSDRERILIDPTNALRWSYEVLSDPYSHKWQDVSFALALVTGRRQGEIHSTGIFKPYVSNDVPEVLAKVPASHLLMFSGQVKKRGGKSKPYAIPTLVPAQLVLQGIESLQHDDRIYPPMADGKPNKKVNGTIATNLANSGATDSFYNRFFDRIQDVKTEDGKTTKVRTYHKVRSIYANCAVKSFNSGLGKKKDELTFVHYIMGHEADGEKVTSSFILNYDLDFALIPGSVTWIKE